MFCKTYVSRDPVRLLRQLTNLESNFSSSQTVLFSIAPSPSLDEAALTALAGAVSRYPTSLGCLSAPVDFNGPRLGSRRAPTVCSVAAFESQTAISFQSTIPGKEPTQVGRWHSFRKRDSTLSRLNIPRDSTGIDWENVWAKTQTEQSPHSIPELNDVR